MADLSASLSQVHRMDNLAARDQWVNRLHPLVKLFLTVLYVALVVSFPKYDLMGLLGMVLYPVVLFLCANLSVRESLRHLRVVLPLVCLMGICNPIFDHNTLSLDGILLPAGVVSMLTLICKGVLTVLASYLLIATTSIDKLCYALRLLHLPKLLVTQLMLTYRYLSLLLDEASRITQAYTLRAPKQKGIHVKVWGPLVGQLLLRSVDRATAVYESMTLRGYRGEFSYLGSQCRFRWQDGVYLLLWLVLFLLARLLPLVWLLGGWLTRLFL